MKNVPHSILGAAVLAVALATAGCDSSNPETKAQATQSGFSEQAATELSRMELTPDEMQSIAQAKQGGLDDAAILDMVKSVHKRKLKFDLGFALQLLKQQGMGATAMTQLVEIGAIPRWADDIRALKDAQVSDVTIVEICKLGFTEKKDLLSGGEYGQLKTHGLSDAGLLTFVQKEGNAQKAQQLAQDLALGKSEQEALRAVGM
jgi:hypothetical protein